ncbi:uracil-DNA glycosylase [Exiguobacterium flavidum]|uniref:uracil-DNA glycosylase n=1 Tax=Exiguobacterium flavidum TaxID=2184695 RepID=UPI000DF762E3|nr:uracil-DNA glycosylase [Exiguobacterium flavidum]
MQDSWKPLLTAEKEKPYFQSLWAFVQTAYAETTVYPPKERIFHAFDAVGPSDVRCVILGQDPYHGPDQANGLSFSVNDGVMFPPSLRNMFKELESDIGCPRPESGNLEKWAKQGVFLLNAVLTVEAGKAGSHGKKGWETFTDRVIEILSDQDEPIAFILWGNYAKSKKALIDTDKHLVLESVHPSPLSASRGFFGSRPYSKVNAWLEETGRKPIDWCL